MKEKIIELAQFKKQNPKKNIRWIIWEILCGKNLPTIEYICWINDRWDEFFKLKYGKIPEFISVTENEQEEFDNWLFNYMRDVKNG